jgi:hypothetical protein
MDGGTGQFFANRKPKTANKLADGTDVAANLWKASADLVGMEKRLGEPRHFT